MSRSDSLRRNGTELPLRPKSFALLQYLIIHAGRLVTKDELLSEIWPNVIVTEDSLTRCISEARAALGDTDQKMIKTVSRRGYVFAGAGDEIPDDPVVSPAAEAPSPGGGTVFGDGGGTQRCWSCSAVLALAGSLVRRILGGQPTEPLPRLSLIVLPFREFERRSGPGLSRRHHRREN